MENTPTEEVTITDIPVENAISEISTPNPQIETPQVEAKAEKISTINLIACSCPIDKPCEHFPERQPIEIKLKNVGGRPCEYCSRAVEIEVKTQKYLNDCRGRNGAKPTIPFVEELADILDIDSDTVDNWATKKKEDNSLEHPIFFGTIKRIKNYQKLQLLKRTLGRFNPSGAIFQLKANHGLMESEKQILAGDKKEPLEIIITEARTKKDE